MKSLISTLIICLLFSLSSVAQTKGFIYQTGSVILDPNSDGYTSETTSGFAGDGHDVDEFEITMFPLPTLGTGEALGDISSGPNCGFTDLAVDDQWQCNLFCIRLLKPYYSIQARRLCAKCKGIFRTYRYRW